MTATDEVQSSGLSLDDLAPEQNVGSVRVYPRGAIIWSRGEPLNSVFFLRRGRASIIVHDEREHESIVRIVQTGEPLSLACFSDQRRRAAPTSAVANVRSELVEIPCEEFMFLVRRNERALSGLLVTLSEQVSHAEERLRILVNHDAEDRVCALLEQMVQRLGRRSHNDPGRQMLYLTHSELAGLAGLSRAHVSVIMGRLRSAGLVRYDRSMPLILNREALAARRAERRSDTIAPTKP
jgi:CRP/FNR family cyclic AMP-dependent transcriptional regulator